MHPDAMALLDLYANRGAKPLSKLGVLRARDAVASSIEFAGPREKVALVRDDLIDADDHLVPVRRYLPTSDPRASIIYLHGGGWVTGDVATADPACRALANATSCEVISVDYRRSPEARYPAALVDAFEVLRESKKQTTRPCFVAGDSAGGGLAASLALMARDENIDLAGQILIYPALTPASGSGDPDEGDGLGLCRADMAFFWRLYLGDQDVQETYAAPLLVDDLSKVAPVLILVAENDILRSEAELFAQRLSESGVAVELSVAKGMIHGFFWQFGAVPSARSCLLTINQFVERYLS